MAKNWKDYQEEAAAFFRSIGMDASTDVTIKGVRTTHAVDVLVKSNQVGFEVAWMVECKHWATPVSKLHVLALREIVSDTGSGDEMAAVTIKGVPAQYSSPQEVFTVLEPWIRELESKLATCESATNAQRSDSEQIES